MDIRRVVTGHDEQGRAVVASDEVASPVSVELSPGWAFHRVWGVDTTASFPDDGSRPEAPLYFPPLEGCRFAFFTVPPDAEAVLPEDIDFDAALLEFQAKLPGLGEHLEPEHPGMHTTATIDFGVVVAGTATLELDDGVKVTLRTGDTYVQNGTRHRWSNQGDVPAVVAVVLIGAHHEGVR